MAFSAVDISSDSNYKTREHHHVSFAWNADLQPTAGGISRISNVPDKDLDAFTHAGLRCHLARAKDALFDQNCKCKVVARRILSTSSSENMIGFNLNIYWAEALSI